MAPKRKQQQQPKKAAAPKRAIEVFQLDCEAFTTPTKSARRTRSAEDMAKRTANENVADFIDHQKHPIRVLENDGRTLTEELVHQHDLRMSNSPLAVKMGKLYYDHQRSLYQLDESPIKKRKTIDNGQPDIAGLSAALAQACKCPKRTRP